MEREFRVQVGSIKAMYVPAGVCAGIAQEYVRPIIVNLCC